MSVEDAAQIFLSTPSARRATAQTKLDIAKQAQFLSTPSARRATPFPAGCSGGKKISIHALREEGDCRRACFSGYRLHISIHALREEGDHPVIGGGRGYAISIHALREEGDHPVIGGGRGYAISIHALREEGDSKNGEKHLRFCFIIKRSAQIWKSLSKNIRKNSCDLHRTA